MKKLSPLKELPPFTHEDYLRVCRETEESDRTEPRIDRTTYDNRSRLLHLAMRGGAGVDIPIDLFDDFNGATPEQIANCKLHENGASLHWDELDIQMETISILQIAFRFRTVTDNARQAGSARSPAKAAAARRNGAKGGRPKKRVVA